jgi:hypothetical protein
LDAISAEDHGGATVAVTITTGFALSRISDIKDANGPYEVELRSADVYVRAILNEPEGPVSENRVISGFWSLPGSLNWGNGIAVWIGLSRSSPVVLEERFKDADCIV